MHAARLMFAVLGLLATIEAASQPLVQTAQTRATEPWLSGTVVTWPAAGQRQLVVIESPAGDQLRELFEVGEQPSLDLADLPTLPDGSYQYSHRLLSAEEGGRPTLLGGSLRVLGGRLQARKREQVKSPAELQTMAQPLTESGSAPFLWLDDTSTNGSGTDDNWWIFADGSGNEEFSIYWDPDHGPSTTWTEPFRIEPGVNDFALYVDGAFNGSGEIGINTHVPSANLHLVDTAPSLKLENAAGHSWEIGSSSSEFFLNDGSTFRRPFVVRTGAPKWSLAVDSSGNVGMGTPTPQGNLHIWGQAGHDVFSGIGPNLVQGPAFNFGYAGASYGLGSGFFNARPAASAVAPNPALYFMTNNVDRMMIDRDGDMAVDMDDTFGNSFDPQHPIHAQQSGAYLSASGVWRDASSRALKDRIAPLSLDAALSALHALEPVTYVYKAEPGDQVVGFIAEDVPELVATPDRKTLAPTDIVGVLTKVVQEQRRSLEEQRRLVQTQQRELEAQHRVQQEQQAVVRSQRRVVAEQQEFLEEQQRELRALRQEVTKLRLPGGFGAGESSHTNPTPARLRTRSPR